MYIYINACIYTYKYMCVYVYIHTNIHTYTHTYIIFRPENVQSLLIWQEWFSWHWCNLAAKESGLECACVNNDNFTVLVSGRCHWVSMCPVWPSHSIWLSEQSNKSAPDFVLSLNIPLWKLFGWFRRSQLWATDDQKLHHDNVPAGASDLLQSFLVKHQKPK